MRRLSSTQGRDTDVPQDAGRRSAAIAAMGYRLAAAGPRTRQRLIDRETAPPAPLREEPRFNEPLPALASWDESLWEQRLAADAELGIARLSDQQKRFPVWRAAALLASAACGFSLVLFGQSLHLDRKLRPARPTLVAEAQPPAPPPAPPAATTLPAQKAAPTAPPQPDPVPVQAQAAAQAAPAAPGSEASPAQAMPPPETRLATLPLEHIRLHPAPAVFAERQPLRRITPRLVLAMASRPPVPKFVDPKLHVASRSVAPRHDLPRWLTEDRPEHERELIMSPPPRNLDAPPSAELAANTHPAGPPKADLPPIPQPGRRPALMYAEAHAPPPPYGGWGVPHPMYNATPYYAPYPQAYGYYGAMPPATPY
jgi:hypothetical protein